MDDRKNLKISELNHTNLKIAAAKAGISMEEFIKYSALRFEKEIKQLGVQKAIKKMGIS